MARPERTNGADRGDDGFVKHRCTCARKTVLGSYGTNSAGQTVYKQLWRERVSLIYFGAFTIRCPSCGTWTRVRMLPREGRVEISQLDKKPD